MTDRRAFAAPAVLLLAAALSFNALAQYDCEGVSRVEETGLKTVTVATGLPGRPLYAVSPPADPGRLFIVDQDGRILLKKRGDAPNVTSTALDLTTVVSPPGIGNELGLLGLAFSPDYDTDAPGEDYLYVNYTETVTQPSEVHYTVVARYRIDPSDPDVVDDSEELRILRFQQESNNHNGGWIDFGVDGFLYVATGDGGGAGDLHGTCGNGQNKDNLFGAMLRLDVRGLDPDALPPDCGSLVANYEVPSDNPLVAAGGCDEIYAYGLRNPWRSSFDPGDCDAETGQCALYIADVGQSCWEEVNYVDGSRTSQPPEPVRTGGENYGWRQMEGNHCYQFFGSCDPPNQSCGSSPDCHDPSLTLPVMEIDQNEATSPCSVTGGYVYRGCRMTGIQGTYFYGDYCAGWIRSFEVQEGVAVNEDDWSGALDPSGSLAFGLTSFGRDAEGEIYIVDRSGEVLKISPLFTDLLVSGPGVGPASSFLLRKSPEAWTWEDLQRSSDHPVDTYRVYRGMPGGDFACVFSDAASSWPAGGDPDEPLAGEFFAYLVTAVSPDAEETGPGTGSEGQARSLLPGGCP